MIVDMPTYSAPDGTKLAYRVRGEGAPVACLAGGPMSDSSYLGDLGGLAAHRQLLMVDPRGTGASAIPQDATSYRCDRLVDDVEALREHLGLERLDLLGHSAGANLAAQYAARHPDRVGRLVLVTPSTMAVGLAATGQSRLETAQLRSDEPGSRPPSRLSRLSLPARPPTRAARPSRPSSTAGGTPPRRLTMRVRRPAGTIRPRRSSGRKVHSTRRLPGPRWPR
jgi:pimeloyl-ACP methyl ester carboxylesterase